MWIDITEKERETYNKLATHPLQSYEWGEFRKKTGVKVIRRGFEKNTKLTEGFTLTIHKIPHTKFTIGYLPKGSMLTTNLLQELRRIGRSEHCVFIQLEPNVLKSSETKIKNLGVVPSAHPLFTKYTFILDISKPEEELLKNFHHKTRYNIKVALKRKVKIEEDNSDNGFKEYLKLTDETTTRQKFYAHTHEYHRKMWESLGIHKSQTTNPKSNSLTAHLLKATYKPDGGKTKTLATWILFVFQDTLYYPYGASSSQFRNTMASNLIMWEAIKFGKKLGLTKFDMWGALGQNPDPKDSWYGFHRFKEGYGAVHTEFAGSFDLIINPSLYQLYKVADKARWIALKMKAHLQ